MGGARVEDFCAPRHSYVVDENHRVVYLDGVSKKLFPQASLGCLCYDALRGGTHPCPDCPLTKRALEHDALNQNLVYNHNLRQWIALCSLAIEWPNCGTCTLISAKGLDENDKDLFHIFSQQASYDELFEINISEKTYKALYRAKAKYLTPPLSGSLENRLLELSNAIIHPDDRQQFLDFWNIDNIESLLAQTGMRKHEFRVKLNKGGYGWTSQTTIPVQRGERDTTALMCFVVDIDEQRQEEERVRNNEATSSRQLVAERDVLTGLYTTFAFLDRTEKHLVDNAHEPFDLLYIDIDHFKIFNEWHGRDAGDQLIKALSNHLSNFCAEHQGIAGYLGGDDFVVLVPRKAVTPTSLMEIVQLSTADFEDSIGFLPVVGICEIDDCHTAPWTLCDHALTALNSIKGSYSTRTAYYDNTMTERLEQEPKILLEVQRALKNKEFILYWQPKCNALNGKIIGLEALVRWEHPEHGLVMPGEFIPLLEKSGFIASLDLYVWEEVCRTLQAWTAEGHHAIPVSVNISRADIFSIDVLESLNKLIEKYQIDRTLLELEITESAYVEDENISAVATQLQEAGFTILMDDFGSGYSSLNMLKDLNVDVLKIDMKFLEPSKKKTTRGENILRSVISMAQLMELDIIAEGVETREQVDFLIELGCPYIQGYFFYRPLSTEALETILSQTENVDFSGMQQNAIQRISLTNLIKDGLGNKMLLDNLVGGVAVYEVYENRFEILQANERYYQVTKSTPDALAQQRDLVYTMTLSADRKLIISLFDSAERHVNTGAEGTFRRHCPTGGIMWIYFRVFFLREQDGRKLFCASLIDITKQKELSADTDTEAALS
ncbi:MAG: bifunctional diguanylate cyclase/phosphodiesterase [Raoultibacter sp.]